MTSNLKNLRRRRRHLQDHRPYESREAANTAKGIRSVCGREALAPYETSVASDITWVSCEVCYTEWRRAASRIKDMVETFGTDVFIQMIRTELGWIISPGNTSPGASDP